MQKNSLRSKLQKEIDSSLLELTDNGYYSLKINKGHQIRYERQYIISLEYAENDKALIFFQDCHVQYLDDLQTKELRAIKTIIDEQHYTKIRYTICSNNL